MLRADLFSTVEPIVYVQMDKFMSIIDPVKSKNAARIENMGWLKVVPNLNRHIQIEVSLLRDNLISPS